LLSIPVLVAAIVLVSFALRFYCLDCHGLWGDEVASVDGAALGFPDMLTGRYGWLANQTPFHYFIVWLSTLPASPVDTTIWVRLPQALAGALTPLVVYGLGKETLGRTQGVLGAALVVFSAVHLNYSQELRPYATLVLLSTLSVYALVKAERTGQVRWWVAFAGFTALNLLNTYVALTFFIPALTPYLAWLLWKLWRGRSQGDGSGRFARAALGALAVLLVCALVYVDMVSRPRTAPDLGRLSPETPLNSLIELTGWMVRFGLDGQWERGIQLLLLLTAIGGSIAAVRDGRTRQHAVLLISLVVVPAFLLALFSTTGVVFQRYALFIMPPYFLLVGNGIAALVTLAQRAGVMVRRVLVVGGVFVAALCIGASVWGTVNYYSPDTGRLLTYRPDFRGVARYLAEHVTPMDVIVFVDDPGLGYTTTGYYLGGRFPAPAYDARDPRLFAHEAKGSSYWVISAESLPNLEQNIAAEGSNAQVARFTRVAVLREDQPEGGLVGAAERMADMMAAQDFRHQPLHTLRGSILQARGDVEGAAAAYREAGMYFPLGNEYEQTARGFEARGDGYRAWREAVIAKYCEPTRPETHLYLSRKLREAGYLAESRIEAQLAEELGQK
jgi:4-amino-4-deoxy-L-arabinose transferase-like glycosyltransferase